jgi:hypothetical protein
MLQSIFKKLLRANKPTKEILCVLVGRLLKAIIQAAADSMKIMVQIKPKAQSGGFQSGCFNEKYQGPISVANPPATEVMIIHAAIISKYLRSKKIFMP